MDQNTMMQTILCIFAAGALVLFMQRRRKRKTNL